MASDRCGTQFSSETGEKIARVVKAIELFVAKQSVLLVPQLGLRMTKCFGRQPLKER